MAQNLIKTFLIVVVSIFGLISCKSESPVVVQGEKLNVGDIEVQNKDRSYFLASDLKELELAGTLKINSLKEHDFTNDPLTIEMKALCQGAKGRQTFDKITYWQNTFNLNVYQLIPEEALLLLDPQDLYCDFTMIVKNQLSSTHTSEIKNIRIKDKDTFNNFIFSEANPFTYQESSQLILRKSDRVQQAYLSCDDFFLVNKDQGMNLEKLLASEFPIRTLQSPQQRCRLLIKEQQEVYLSNYFNLLLPYEAPQITWDFSSLQYAQARFEDLEVIHYTIFNPNDFALKIKIDTTPAVFYMTPILFTLDSEQWHYKATSENFPIQWQTNGQALTGTFIIIPAKSHINVSGIASIYRNCLDHGMTLDTVTKQAMTFPKALVFAGINFNYSKLDIFSVSLGEDQLVNILVNSDFASQVLPNTNPYWLMFEDFYKKNPRYKNFYNGFKNPPKHMSDVFMNRRCLPL